MFGCLVKTCIVKQNTMKTKRTEVKYRCYKSCLQIQILLCNIQINYNCVCSLFLRQSDVSYQAFKSSGNTILEVEKYFLFRLQRHTQF